MELRKERKKSGSIKEGANKETRKYIKLKKTNKKQELEGRKEEISSKGRKEKKKKKTEYSLKKVKEKSHGKLQIPGISEGKLATELCIRVFEYPHISAPKQR
jgi:hypothetical protein